MLEVSKVLMLGQKCVLDGEQADALHLESLNILSHSYYDLYLQKNPTNQCGIFFSPQFCDTFA